MVLKKEELFVVLAVIIALAGFSLLISSGNNLTGGAISSVLDDSFTSIVGLGDSDDVKVRSSLSALSSPDLSLDHFIFQVNATTDYNFSFRIDGANNMFVDWGDGSDDTYTASVLATHNYTSPGVHNVSIRGNASRVAFWGWGVETPELLHDILNNMSTGVSGITSGGNMFRDIVVSNFTEEHFFDEVSSNVSDLTSMFRSASNFNGNISSWDVSNVTSMVAMFRDASSFNGDISNWDVSDVINMGHIFYGASNFNGDISNWDVSNVDNMFGMFRDASSFNGDLSSWNVSNVGEMNYMFQNADIFNGDLSSWNVSGVTDMTGMFSGANLSNNNYDSLLVGWNNLSSLQNNVNFHAGDAKYCSGASAKLNITSTYNWSITDGGLDVNCSNTPPTVNFHNFTPGAVFNNTNLTVYINYSDLEMSNGTINFSWYVNGVNVYNETKYNVTSNTLSNSTLSFTNFTVSDLVNVSFIASDGENSSSLEWSSTIIVNAIIEAPPVVNFINFTPETIFTNTNLTVYINYSDLEMSNGSINFTWYVNDINVYNGTVSNVTSGSDVNSTLSSSFFNKSDLINLSFIASDGTNVSDLVWSPSILVNDSAPVLTSLILNASDHPLNLSNATLELFPTFFDLDNSSLTLDNLTDYSIMWYLNGFLQPGLNDTNRSSINTSIGDVFYVNASIQSEGTLWSDWFVSNSLIIQDSAPIITSVNILNDDLLNKSSGNLTVSYTYSDHDSRDINNTLIIWFKDGVEQSDLENLTTIDSSNTSMGELWSFNLTIQANNSLLWSTTESSNSLEINKFYLDDCDNLDDSSETYYLENGIVDSAATTCMNISANNVTLDCQGNTIGGTGTGVGVLIDRTSLEFTNVTVTNCTISDWGSGLSMTNNSFTNLNNLQVNSNQDYGFNILYSHNNTFDTVNSTNNRGEGFSITSSSYNTFSSVSSIDNNASGVVLDGSNFNNLSLESSGNSENGFSFSNSDNNHINYSLAFDNGWNGFYLEYSEDNTFSSISSINNLWNGFALWDSNDNNTFDTVNSTTNNLDGFYLFNSSENNLINVISYNNSDDGFHLTSSNDNTFDIVDSINNSDGGFYLTSSDNNTFDVVDSINNSDGFLIGSSNNTFTSVNSIGNTDDGFDLRPGSNGNTFTSVNSINNSDGGFYLWNSSNNTLTSVNSTNNTGRGFHLMSSHENTFNNINSYGNFEQGFYLTLSNNNTFDTVNSIGNTDDGFHLKSSNNNTFDTVNSINNTIRGFYLTSSNSTTFDTVNSIGNTDDGFHLTSSNNNTFDIVDSINNSDNGFYLTSSNDNTFISVNSINNTIRGFYLTSSNSTTFDTVNSTINTLSGFFLISSNDNAFDTVNSINNSNYGFYLRSDSNNNTFDTVNSINNSIDGFHLTSSNNNTFTSVNSISNTGDGFYLWGSSNNNFNEVNSSNNPEMDFSLAGSIETCDQTFENVTVSKGVPLYFSNESITLENIDNASLIILCDADNSTLTNITIDNSGLNNNGVVIYYTDNSTFSNIQLANSYLGFEIGDSYDNSFTNLNSVNNFQDGYYVHSSNYNSFNTLSSINNSKDGFDFSGIENNVFYDINSVNNFEYGFKIYNSNNNTFSTFNSINNNFTGIDVVNSDEDSFLDLVSINNLGGGFDFDLSTNNTFDNIIAYNNLGGGFDFDWSTNNTLVNIVAYNNSGSGLSIGPHQTNDNAFINPAIYNNSGQEISDESDDTTKNYLIFNNSFGRVEWINDSFLQNLTLDADIALGNNLFISSNDITLNTSEFISASNVSNYINSTANVTFYNLNNMVNTFPRVNGVLCDETCHNFTYANLEANFIVDHFTTYSVGGTLVVEPEEESSSSGGGSGPIPGAENSVSTHVDGVSHKEIWTQIFEGESASVDVDDDDITIQTLAFTADKDMKGVWVEVKVADSEDVDEELDSLIYQYIKLTKGSTLDGEYVEEFDINFQVSNEWLEENNLGKESVSLYHHTGGFWEEISTSMVSSDELYTYYFASVGDFSYFAVSSSTEEVVTSSVTTPEEESVEELYQPTVDTSSPAGDSEGKVVDSSGEAIEEPLIKAPSKLASLLPISMSLFWIIVILGFVLHYRADRKKRRSVVNYDEAVSYLLRLSAQGIGGKEIAEELHATGWSKEEIEIIFKLASKSANNPHSSDGNIAS